MRSWACHCTIVACRVLLEARLRPGALTHTPPSPRQPTPSSDPSTWVATSLPSPVLGVQHRLALTYALPSGEQQASSLLVSALPPARPGSAATEGADTQPATSSSAEAPVGVDGAAPGPTVLQWKAEHTVSVDEALVRSWAGSHAALPVVLKAASRTQLPPPAEAAADAADAAAGGPAAKGVTGEGKGVVDGCLERDHNAHVFLPLDLKAKGKTSDALQLPLQFDAGSHLPSVLFLGTALARGAAEGPPPWQGFMPSWLPAQPCMSEDGNLTAYP